MSPYKHYFGQTITTDAQDVVCDRSFISHYQVAAADAVAASDTAVHAAITLPTSGTTTVNTSITNPAVPRALRIKGNAAGITGNVVITGTNYNGDVITETIVANGASAVEGNKAFKTVTQIVVPTRTQASDTISIGFNEKLGLPYLLAHNAVLFAYLDNAKEGTAPTVTVSTTVLESNTIDLNTALSGKIVDVYLVV
jgi:hypothetical protein